MSAPAESPGPVVAVVDDEPEIRETIEEYLQMNGFAVVTAGDGRALRSLLQDRAVDLVLLDLNMPGEDGLSLARFLRAETRAAIIMLTAAGSVVDRIVGLEMGADDYIPKPVDLRELLARVRAVLRRAGQPAAAGNGQAATADEDSLCFAGHRLDLGAHRLYAPDGREIVLTGMEFDLLRAFAEHPNRVLSRDQLLEMAHHRSWEPFDRSIDIRIARLRRKLERDPAKPELIKTVRGAGYLFAVQPR
jgi:two-component system phosphate regulon response regulator OmpR